MIKEFDYIVIGSGMYGMYAAKYLLEKGLKVAILEFDDKPFQRASYINQARVHNGYHYPRSYSTAIKSAKYFNRFNDDFKFAINNKFKQIYAISDSYSMVSGEQFYKFCINAHIPAYEISPKAYFNKGTIDAAFETEEYSFDAGKIKDYFLEKINSFNDVEKFYDVRIKDIEKSNEKFIITLNDNIKLKSEAILNATYASINQILDMANYEKFKIKYEICEIIICDVSDNIKNIGLTVMDGPFFSVMPFGLNGVHSLTAVCFTPHKTSYDMLPTFDCQKFVDNCTPKCLNNCNLCKARPQTAWIYMRQLSKKYLLNDIKISYIKSLFAIKPILMASEIDDSRPTVVRVFEKDPTFISVLSGKINTVYDLEEVL